MFSKIFHRRRKQMNIVVVKNFNVGGKIILSHCSGRDTIIIFFQTDGFREVHKRLLSKNFGCR